MHDVPPPFFHEADDVHASMKWKSLVSVSNVSVSRRFSNASASLSYRYVNTLQVCLVDIAYIPSTTYSVEWCEELYCSIIVRLYIIYWIYARDGACLIHLSPPGYLYCYLLPILFH